MAKHSFRYVDEAICPGSGPRRRGLLAAVIALAAVLLPGNAARAETAPALELADITSRPVLYRMVQSAGAERGEDSLTLMVQVLALRDKKREKQLDDLFAGHGLTTSGFCKEPLETIYISSVISGVYIAKAGTSTAFQSVSKYCRTAGSNPWSYVASNEVFRDLTKVDPATGDVLEHRTLALMGLSTRDIDMRRARSNRYPAIALSTSEGMSRGSDYLAPLERSPLFLREVPGAGRESLSTSNPYAAGIDIGGLILLAKTISLPIGGDGALNLYTTLRGTAIPLTLTVEELPKGQDDLYTPFQLVARSERGTGAITIRVKGDRSRTIASIDAPIIGSLVTLYSTFRVFTYKSQ